nr:MAG TPA: hypothetical protein [Caudoviricetes sp.]
MTHQTPKRGRYIISRVRLSRAFTELITDLILQT